ncbi:L,D-transpeptidase family protein [Microvirga massiliensis]|uniref:L,D-transpeptidase family protein n=1 Tax=Microvirga massiliensis TaxID=1033741 RepID=UPI00069C9DA8|nr:murein L,D-transpeptidase family protein [Microvirga massiliensis]
MMKRFGAAAALVLALAACQDDGFQRSSRHLSPIPPSTLALMASKGMSKNDPIVIRSYKKESELEVWKRGSDGRFALLKTYPICRWSGQLGPKVREGDRQAPEGFYAITPAQMNPNSSYYLSFDTGYPNAFDRAHGRTGSHLMVHGSCSSRGCFAMTDEVIAEVYAIARESFAGGQRTFQFQSYPFRMTPKNIAQHRLDQNMPFWKNLKEGSDYFEAVGQEPKVAVCGKRYVFGGADVAQGNCSPALEPAVAVKQTRDEQEVAALVAKGVEPIKLVYQDGGQHQSFRQNFASADGAFAVDSQTRSRRLGDVSRPEALAAGPHEIVLDVNGRPKEPPSSALAFAAPAPAASPIPQTPRAVSPRVAPNAPALAAPPQMAAAATSASPESDKPLYERMLSGLTTLWSSSSPSTRN